MAAIGLAILTGAVYLATLRPGLGTGDTADFQYQSAFMGVCHDPGYRLAVLAGWFFSRLPLGADLAWRINLLTAISGVVGCLALYGIVMRMTGSIVAAVVSAGLLGFSSIYWAFSITAEVYVFYSAFLLLGAYFAVRFAHEQRARFLLIGCFFIGVCIADRPSELFILPAFLGLWLGFRKHIQVHPEHLLTAAACLVFPFLLTLTYHIARHRPESFYHRGDALRDRILATESQAEDSSTRERVREALRYSLGLRWTDKAGVKPSNVARGLARYARLLSGAGALDKRPPEPFQWERGLHGTSIGSLGVLSAIVGAVLWRRHLGYVLLGGLLFLGNLLFYLWYYVEHDGLTFTIPGLAGLALLAGLGVAGSPTAASVRWRWCAGSTGLAAVLFLLVTNWRLVDLSRVDNPDLFRLMAARLKAEVPQDSAIIASWGDVNRYKYLLHVLGQRYDVVVMEVDVKLWRNVIAGLAAANRPTFVLANYSVTDPRVLKLTPRGLVSMGLYCVHLPGVSVDTHPTDDAPENPRSTPGAREAPPGGAP